MAGVSNPKCNAPFGEFQRGYDSYLKSCTNSPALETMRDSFFSNQVNIKAQFDDARAIAQSEATDISSLLGGMIPNSNGLAKHLAQLKDNENSFKKNLAEVRDKTEALNVQFLNKKETTPGPVDKPSVLVLQDYILAGFSISYLLCSLTLIFYFTKKSGYSTSTFMICIAIFLFITFLIAALIINSA
jgi:hypothetical protein